MTQRPNLTDYVYNTNAGGFVLYLYCIQVAVVHLGRRCCSETRLSYRWPAVTASDRAASGHTCSIYTYDTAFLLSLTRHLLGSPSYDDWANVVDYGSYPIRNLLQLKNNCRISNSLVFENAAHWKIFGSRRTYIFFFKQAMTIFKTSVDYTPVFMVFTSEVPDGWM